MNRDYHLIPYDFEVYDFEEFRREEIENKGRIRWLYGKRKHVFNTGDVCYLYCFNLPDRTRRILLRAEVCGTECKDDNGEECFVLCNVRPVRLSDPDENGENIIKYSYENMSGKYGIKTVQGKQRLQADGIHKQLIADLESEPVEGSLTKVKKYFENMTKCAFEGHDNNPKLHQTFLKENGFFYFETHHVVQQNTARNYSISEEEIENLNNKVYLCSRCHDRIHYGKKEDVRKMVEFLYTRKEGSKDWFDATFENVAEKEGFSSVFDWIYSLYRR